MSTNTAEPEAKARAAVRDRAADRKQEQEQERVELYGTAKDLFVSRHEDTFELEIHGNEIEFHRPMDATDIEMDADGSGLGTDTFDRLQRGSELLDRFEDRQRKLIQATQGGDMSLEELLDESMDATELMCRILATHAVDESLTDYRVWQRLYCNDEVLSSLFEDFINEGESERTREKLQDLDGLMSGSSSPT